MLLLGGGSHRTGESRTADGGSWKPLQSGIIPHAHIQTPLGRAGLHDAGRRALYQ